MCDTLCDRAITDDVITAASAYIEDATNLAGTQKSSPIPFEVLYGAFVLLRALPRVERTEVFPLTSLWIHFA